MTVHSLLRAHAPGSTFASRSGQPISVETFLRDVVALADLLPARGAMVNLCPDRYRFTVGFAAALCRGQIALLPPHDAPDLLEQLRTDYPDLYCLTDPDPSRQTDAASAAAGGVPVFHYPPVLEHTAATPEVPAIAAEQPAAVLFTSGSTGRPTPHARTWGELVSSAWAEGRRLNVAALGAAVSDQNSLGQTPLVQTPLGQTSRAPAALLGTVPHQHSYGLESLVMLALQHGLILHAERLFFPADIRAELAAASRPRMLVTTPVHLRVLLAEPETPPPVDLVLCATAPLATHLAREAEARFATALYEIYGCSEAGQIAARRTAVTEEWQCLDGITLRQDAAGTWASGEPIAVETLLPDVIELLDPTRFRLHGRIADMVNVAGKRTSLVHLNYHLNAIDGVRDGAFVLADEAETEGVARLTAFVVAPGRTADFILSELRRRIDVAFLPRPICLVPDLPRNALGKLPREEIRRLIAAARTGQDRAGTSPTGQTATWHFPVGHPAAEGHFPGNPIIPGAVLLRDILAAVRGTGEAGYDIRSAKFHRPVRPGDTVEIVWTGRLAADGVEKAPVEQAPVEQAAVEKAPVEQEAVEKAGPEGGEIRFSCAIAGSDRPAVTGVLRPRKP